MTIEEMNARKRELGYTNGYLAKLSGIPVSTVNKILSGATKAPRLATLRALSAVLEKRNVNYLEIIKEEDAIPLQEAAPAYQAPVTLLGYRMGPYTIEDYLALPDEDRRELIDGYFFTMEAPTSVHQLIAGQIHRQLCDIVDRHDGKCLPLISPIDVQVDLSERTIVQPDVIVICRPEEVLTKKRIVGAPDLAVEVLSSSTRGKDMTIKLNKYYESGVREYWIVDPDTKKTLVYDLENDSYIPEIYDFTVSVPVKIWDGAETIDFVKIEDYINRYKMLYE